MSNLSAFAQRAAAFVGAFALSATLMVSYFAVPQAASVAAVLA